MVLTMRCSLVILFALFLPNDGKSVPTPPPMPSNQSAVSSANVSNIAMVEEDITNFMVHYRKLRGNTSDAAMRLLVTLGLVSGALKVEDAMKANLNRIASDMFVKFNVSTPKENMHKLLRIEETMERDRASINILESILAFARNAKNFGEFQKDMQRISKENEASMEKLRNERNKMSTEMVDKPKKMQTVKLMQRSEKSIKYEMFEKLNDVREMIDKHMNEIHSTVTDSAKRTIAFVQALQVKNADVDAQKRNKNEKKSIKLNSALGSLLKVWSELKPKNTSPDVYVSFEFKDSNEKDVDQTSDTENESNHKLPGIDTKIDRLRRQDVLSDKPIRKNGENEIDGDGGFSEERNGKQEDDEKKKEGDEFDESESGSSEEQGGLLGLITSLSGGDEGSDVGALIGALTQVITNLLGPNGIDVPSVIGSATSVLASLLAGDENFGKVLGNYVGLGLDGFSGGGGAANNGQFFGQFIGKFVSSLSADPDDEDLPPKPDIFIQNFFDGIQKGAGKKSDTPEGENPPAGGGGSDSGSFITHVITTIVAGIASGIANASLGSSGGSSQGSAGLFTGSAHGSSSQSHNKT